MNRRAGGCFHGSLAARSIEERQLRCLPPVRSSRGGCIVGAGVFPAYDIDVLDLSANLVECDHSILCSNSPDTNSIPDIVSDP